MAWFECDIVITAAARTYYGGICAVVGYAELILAGFKLNFSYGKT